MFYNAFHIHCINDTDYRQRQAHIDRPQLKLLRLIMYHIIGNQKLVGFVKEHFRAITICMISHERGRARESENLFDYHLLCSRVE